MSDDRIKSKPIVNPLSHGVNQWAENHGPENHGPENRGPENRGAENRWSEFRPASALPTAVGLACQWEVLAAKPGNVHRLADFADMGLNDFLASALAVAGVTQAWLPRWSNASGHPSQADQAKEVVATGASTFGEFIYDAIRATRAVTSVNTNLGICLLLGPLVEAYARCGEETEKCGETVEERLASWASAAGRLIERAGVEQTRWIYRAICLANPGGMGQVDQADIQALAALQSTDTVAHVMGLAAERDSIAAEYLNGYTVTCGQIVPDLARHYAAGYGLQWATIATFVRRLATTPDTLIVRKVGATKAGEVSTWAGRVADQFFPAEPNWAVFQSRQDDCEALLSDLDFALRSDGHRLNPGTTADFVAAGLFVASMSGLLAWPVRW